MPRIPRAPRPSAPSAARRPRAVDGAARPARVGVAGDVMDDPHAAGAPTQRAPRDDVAAAARPTSAPGPHAAAPVPIDARAYDAIVDELAAADWTGMGIDPVRYVFERFDRDLFLDPLVQDPAARVVLHRDALRISDVAGLNPAKLQAAMHDGPRDFPARVHRSKDGVFHVTGAVGEDWEKQTLMMLAQAGVPRAKVFVEGTFSPADLARSDLDDTLAAQRFDHVAVGPVGELTRAVERALREDAKPAYATKVFAEMRVVLDDARAAARPGKRARWDERAALFDAIAASQRDDVARIASVQAEPALAGPLGELVRRFDDGPPVEELPLKSENGKAKVLTHRVLDVRGKRVLVLHVGGAHGDLARHAVARALDVQPWIDEVSMYGTAGSLSTKIGPDTASSPSLSRRHRHHASERGEVPVRLA